MGYVCQWRGGDTKIMEKVLGVPEIIKGDMEPRGLLKRTHNPLLLL